MARRRTFVLAAAALLAASTASIEARADAAITILHTFGGLDGAQPLGALLLDRSGNIFGTTNAGGAHNNLGTVFEISGGTETVLHSFFLCPGSGTCTEGNSPQGPLLMDKSGNLFGSAAGGGGPGKIAGAVFMLAPDGTEMSLHSFCSKSNCGDGEQPSSGVLMDKSGNLFGMTSRGGASNFGAVFQLTPGSPQYTATTLYSFCSRDVCVDGSEPERSGLTVDKKGNFYGTTSQGGAFDNGEVFKLSPNGDGSYSLSVLYSFCKQSNKCPDGEAPFSGVIMDKKGNLYGTTQMGGTGNLFQSESAGVVFQLTPNGSGGYTESVVYSFCSQTGCTDGAVPTGALIRDKSGNLYGTAMGGGAHKGGVVFALSPGGTYTVLYDFCAQPACADGGQPMAGVVKDKAGNLYGTASAGGSSKGLGTVFELAGAAAPEGSDPEE